MNPITTAAQALTGLLRAAEDGGLPMPCSVEALSFTPSFHPADEDYVRENTGGASLHFAESRRPVRMVDLAQRADRRHDGQCCDRPHPLPSVRVGRAGPGRRSRPQSARVGGVGMIRLTPAPASPRAALATALDGEFFRDAIIVGTHIITASVSGVVRVGGIPLGTWSDDTAALADAFERAVT